jgi:NADH-quinone oxidoreductase subunit N
MWQIEYAFGFLLITAALSICTMAVHFVSLFVLLETVSILSYAVVALSKNKQSLDGAFQYLIFGGVASAFMLFGISILYGVTGQMAFGSQVYTDLLALQDQELVVLAGIMAFGGAFFKLALVPFHAWVPKIFSATPTAWLAYLSTAPKLLGILVLLRLQGSFNYSNQQILTTVAVASLLIGTLAALRQVDARQMLGFSTIAHAGFILLGAIIPSQFGFQTASFYAIAYAIIAFAAFFVVELLKQSSGSYLLESFGGMGQQSGLVGLSAVLVSIALVGLPPTVGFSGKFLIFSNLFQVFSQTHNNTFLILLIFGLLTAAVSLFFYLKIPYYLYLKPSGTKLSISAAQTAYLLALTAAIVLLFFRSDLLLKTLQY